MKKFIIIAFVIAIVGLIGFSIFTKQVITKSDVTIEKNYSESNQQENLRQATLKIDGMWCASCATGAEYALKDKVGVVDASVDYDSKSGRVIYDPLKISKDEIIQAVKPYVAVITKDELFK